MNHRAAEPDGTKPDKLDSMRDIVVRQVSSKSDLSVFLRVPWKIYKGDKYWVPPLLSEQRRFLDRKKNPLFRHCAYRAWVVFRDGEALGRILAYWDSAHNEHYKDKKGFIGFFECVNQQDLADRLFEAAHQWLRQQGMESMCGPMNFSIGNECGVQLDAYDTSPYIQMGHTPPYYRALFETAGFTKEHDLYAYRLNIDDMIHRPPFIRLKNIAERMVMHNQLLIRKVNMKQYKQELEVINTIVNRTLQHNWGFVPSDMEEVLYTADSFRLIMDEEIVLFAEYKNEVVGYCISLPDINQVLIHMNGRLFPFGWIKFLQYKKKISRGRVYLLGIFEEKRLRGLDAVLYYASIRKAIERGYHEAELSWISEDNESMISIVEKIGAERYKTYRMFQKELA